MIYPGDALLWSSGRGGSSRVLFTYIFCRWYLGSLNEPRIIYLSNHYLTILDQEPIIQLLEPSLLRSRELNKNIIWAQEIFILFTTAQFYLRLLEQVSLSLDICRAIITSSHKSKSAASELLYHSRILWWLCLWILNVWDLLSKVKIRINLTGKLGEDLSSDKTFNFSPHRCAAAGGGWELGSDLQKNATIS